MDDCCDNKVSYEPQNNQFAGIVSPLTLDGLDNSTQDVHCLKNASDNILNEMSNLSPQLQEVTENSFHHLESNSHSLLSDGNVLENARTLHVSEYSNGDNAHLQIAHVESIGDTTMLLDSHYYNVLGYDLSPSCGGAFEALIVESPIKACFKEDHKMLEAQNEQSQYLQNNVLTSGPSFCEVPVQQYQNHDNDLCTKNMVAHICPENANQIMLENQGYNKDTKFIELTQQISEEFQFDISNSLSESHQTTTESQPHVDDNFSQVNDDADSEVALTLANLRNMENHHDLSQVCENLLIDNPKMNPSNVKGMNSSNLIRNSKVKKLDNSIEENIFMDETTNSECSNNLPHESLHLHSTETVNSKKSIDRPAKNEDCKKLLSKLSHGPEQGQTQSLILEGVVDDVLPAVGYRIMDMFNLSEMVGMMHNCTAEHKGPVVIQEQVSQREGAVSHISLICTGCQEGTVCPTSNRLAGSIGWDINSRVEKLKKEFNIEEIQLQKMLEILGIFYRPSLPPNTLIKSAEIMKPSATIVKQVGPAKKLNANGKIKTKEKKAANATKEKNYECEACKQKFLYRHHLKIHMSVHNKAGHTCPYCHAYFKKKYNLKEHIKKHENVKYECNLCSREYTDRSTLMKHMSSFHEEKYIVECEFCGKKFYHRAHYNEHKRTHTKETPYCCKICGKKFRFQETSKKHMSCHTQPKFKCIICEKRYRWVSTARQHVSSIHGIVKEEVDSNISEDLSETDYFHGDVLYSQNVESKTGIDDPLRNINLFQSVDLGPHKNTNDNSTELKQTCQSEEVISFNEKQDFMCEVPVQSNQAFLY